MLREIVFIFMALLIFMAFVLYDDNEFTVASKKTIYKTLNKNMEWAGIRKERNLDAFIQIHKRIIKGELPLKVHLSIVSVEMIHFNIFVISVYIYWCLLGPFQWNWWKWIWQPYVFSAYIICGCHSIRCCHFRVDLGPPH